MKNGILPILLGIIFYLFSPLKYVTMNLLNEKGYAQSLAWDFYFIISALLIITGMVLIINQAFDELNKDFRFFKKIKPIFFLIFLLIVFYVYFNRYHYSNNFLRTNIFTGNVEFLCEDSYSFKWRQEKELLSSCKPYQTPK